MRHPGNKVRKLQFKSQAHYLKQTFQLSDIIGSLVIVFHCYHSCSFFKRSLMLMGDKPRLLDKKVGMFPWKVIILNHHLLTVIMA